MQLAHDHASEGPAASSWLAGCGCGGGGGLCRKRFIARYDGGGGGGDGSGGGGSVGGGGEGGGDSARRRHRRGPELWRGTKQVSKA